jgi:hypothetical protein
LLSLSASLAFAGAAAAADCDALTASFKNAIADKSFGKLKDAMTAIAEDNSCNFDIDAYRIQEINSMIDMAGDAPTDDAPKQMLEFVEGVMEIGGSWRSAENLGDFYAHRSEYQEALGAYETAISFLSRAAPRATAKDREELLARAEVAKSQAVSADNLRAPGGGTIRALVLGVDVYSRLPASVQLQGARADAEDVADALSRDGVKPVVLLDTDVTRAKIVAQMDTFVAEPKPGDFVLFAYAGHGMQTPEYARWQGIDLNGVNEQIALSGFSFSGEGVDEIIVNPEIRAWLSRLDAKGVDALVVMDSCFGGGMREVDPRTGAMRTRVLRASAARAGENERAKFAGIPMTAKEARADVTLMPHVTFLAGATSRSVVPETDGLAASGPRGALLFLRPRAWRKIGQGLGDHTPGALWLCEAKHPWGDAGSTIDPGRAAKPGGFDLQQGGLELCWSGASGPGGEHAART